MEYLDLIYRFKQSYPDHQPSSGMALWHHHAPPRTYLYTYTKGHLGQHYTYISCPTSSCAYAEH